MKIIDFISKLRILDYSSTYVSIYDNPKNTDDCLFVSEIHGNTKYNPTVVRDSIHILMNTYIDKSTVGDLSFESFDIDSVQGDIFLTFYLHKQI